MHLKCYDFSGINIGIQSENELCETERIVKFRKDSNKPDCMVKLGFCQSLENYQPTEEEFCIKKLRPSGGEQELSFACAEYSGNDCNMKAIERYECGFGVSSVFKHMPLYHLLLKYDAFIVHASYVLVNGQAILFSAPSQTGKSTQAELWKSCRNAEIINGDRTLIRKNEHGFTAGGIHYSGTSTYCENVTAPIRAIVLLGQAKENTVKKCNGAEAFIRLFRECAYTLDFKNDPPDIAKLLAEVINNIDIIKLDCLPDESSVIALENYLSGENK